MDHYSEEGLQREPTDELSSTTLGLQTLNDHAFNVNEDDTKHIKDNDDDQTLEFFHSLGLQTLQEASKRGDFSKTPLELKNGVKDVIVEGKGSVDPTTAQDLLDVNLWSAVNSDISFVESLGKVLNYSRLKNKYIDHYYIYKKFSVIIISFLKLIY